MKQANTELMKQVAKELYPQLPFDKAMMKIKADGGFVRMRSGGYCVMDKYYNMIR